MWVRRNAGSFAHASQPDAPGMAQASAAGFGQHGQFG